MIYWGVKTIKPDRNESERALINQAIQPDQIPILIYFLPVNSSETVSLCLPFALLRAKTFLPFLLAILALKPCLFFLLRTDG